MCPSGELICGKEETEGHSHNEDCYGENNELICGKEETTGHSHEAACYCPGGELICGKEESEGHAHSEDCYAKGGELLCGFEDAQLPAMERGARGAVSTAEGFRDAFINAQDGDTITLDADISYDHADIGTIEIDKKVTLDFNGHKVSFTNSSYESVFNITEAGSLTLVNAQLDAGHDNSFVEECRGELIIESTAGDGIRAEELIDEIYGKCVIKSGDYDMGNSFINELVDNAEVIIENAKVSSLSRIIDHINEDSCKLTIKNGNYIASDYIIYTVYGGHAVIENGSFQVTEGFFGWVSENGTLTLKNATVISEYDDDDTCFKVEDNGVLNIENGEYTFNGTVIDACDNAAVNLSGGTFTNTSGQAAITLSDNAKVNIAEGYYAVPSDWQETSAAVVKILPYLGLTYEVAPDDTYGCPADATVPVDNTQYKEGDTATVAGPLTTAWTTSDGTVDGIPGAWTFIGWAADTGYSHILGTTASITENRTIYGKWKFIQNPGNLTISKTVSGSGASSTKEFTFTATLGNASISGTYGDLTFENGVATFTLKANESKTATGLPAGVGYTVSESDNSGYTVTVNGQNQTEAAGTIVTGETALAAFNNHKSGGSDPSPAKVTITAEKTLNGQAPNGSDYSFVLKDESGNVIQTVQNNGGSIAFNTLSFSKTGTYIYTISEVPGNDSAINYDTAVYKVIVEVTKSGDYKATVSYEKDGKAYDTTPVFANTTKPVDPENPDKPDTPDKPNTPTTPDKPDTPNKPSNPTDNVPQTGDNSHIGLWAALACLSLFGMIAAMFSRKRYIGKHSR